MIDNLRTPGWWSGIAGAGMEPFMLGLFTALLVGGVSFVLIATFATRLMIMVG